jgi:hypothetical protein
MIYGSFDQYGRPYVQGRLFIPRLQIGGFLDLLVDTGADCTCLHTGDGIRLNIPYETLQNAVSIGGVGGNNSYFNESIVLFFVDENRIRAHFIDIAIARPRRSNLTLPSLLGQDILRNWRMHHEPLTQGLEFVVKQADFTTRI